MNLWWRGKQILGDGVYPGDFSKWGTSKVLAIGGETFPFPPVGKTLPYKP